MSAEKYICIAKAVALCGPGVGKNFYRHGAVVVKKAKVISAGHNELKTHTYLSRFTEFPHLHAETSAILKAGLDACCGSDLYVARVNRKGELANSKPCQTCQAVISNVNIRNVYYTNDQGDIECLN